MNLQKIVNSKGYIYTGIFAGGVCVGLGLWPSINFPVLAVGIAVTGIQLIKLNIKSRGEIKNV